MKKILMMAILCLVFFNFFNSSDYRIFLKVEKQVPNLRVFESNFFQLFICSLTYSRIVKYLSNTVFVYRFWS
jgi:hypothetical protein